MSDSLLKAVGKFFEDVAEFETMDNRRKAAFLGRLTRYEKEVEDDDIQVALAEIRLQVGTGVSDEKVTVEDVELELADSFAGYDTRRQGAFKSKVTRMVNVANAEGDYETADRLIAVQTAVASAEQKAAKERIMRLANSRK